MPRQKKRIIMIVDADVKYATMLGERFEISGWKVYKESKFENALKRISKNEVDVVVVDVEPLVEAIDFFARVRLEKGRGVMLVVLSQTGDRKTITRMLEANAEHFLLKTQSPPNELVKKIKRLFEQRT